MEERFDLLILLIRRRNVPQVRWAGTDSKMLKVINMDVDVAKNNDG